MSEARPLNPLEKVRELVELIQAERISGEDFRSHLLIIRNSLDVAVGQLQEVSFPDDYAPGPKLQEAALQGFQLLEKALRSLDTLADVRDAELATSSLDLAEQAYQVLEQALKAIQKLRLRGK
jgi:hypothetical protein